jgi:hypothetical protein
VNFYTTYLTGKFIPMPVFHTIKEYMIHGGKAMNTARTVQKLLPAAQTAQQDQHAICQQVNE